MACVLAKNQSSFAIDDRWEGEVLIPPFLSIPQKKFISLKVFFCTIDAQGKNL